MAMLLLRFTPGGSFIKFNFIVFQPGSHIHFQMVTYKLKNKIQIKLHRQKLHIALLSHLDTDLEADHIINAFNPMVPFYANVERTPEYLANTTGTVSTDNFYWTSRLIAAMADASYNKSLFHLERYEEAVLSAARALVNQYDAKLAAEPDAARRAALREEANTAIAAMLQEKAADTLDKVLFELSSQMKNAYSRSDA